MKSIFGSLEAAFYLGEEKETGYSGVISEQNLFLIFDVRDGITSTDGRQFLRELKERLLAANISNLSDLEGQVAAIVQEKNLPSHFSLSLGFVKNNILYLKTSGDGEIFIRRKNNVAMLLSSGNSASGHYKQDDIYIFTTNRFIEIVGGPSKLALIFDHKKPSEIVDELTPILKSDDDSGAVAAFLQFGREEEIVADEIMRPVGVITQLNNKFKDYYSRFGKRKTLTFAAVAVIFLILVWSVGLGFARRSNQMAVEKIKAANTLITQNLQTAQDVSYLDMAQAISLIEDSKKQLTDLEKAYPKRKELENIKTQIDAAENRILKKEDKNFSEFFDLALDSQKANGDKLYLDEDALLILDSKNSTLYKLIMDKKSLTKNKASEIASAYKIAIAGDHEYFYIKDAGIFTIDSDGKAKKVIDNDKDWKNIADMATFNGNLYVFDSGSSDVYKYLSSGDSFSAKKSYFDGG
ncbi:MAG: hypothetical protein M1409_05450, partial [Actinobacteria bacterium]|nr:hypothetical protein [Actinomycetota bacterium]